MSNLRQPLLKLKPQRVVEALEAGLGSVQTAGVADIIRLVQMLSNDAMHVSIDELSDIIEKDLIVSSKVITCANKLGYNPHNVEISSIQQAIHVVGFNRIRSLAVSLLMIENGDHLQIPEAQHNTMISICSGLMSKIWAQDNSRSEPDRYFLCGSLRNLGQLLLATHMTEDYRRVMSAISAGKEPKQEYFEVFGGDPLEFTHEILMRASLAPKVLKSLVALKPDVLIKPSIDDVEEVQVVSDFCLRVSEVLTNPDISASAYQLIIHKLLREYQHLQLTQEALNELLLQVEQSLGIYINTGHSAQLSDRLSKQIQLRRTQKPESQSAVTDFSVPALEITQTTGVGAVRTISEHLQEAIFVVSDALSKPNVQLDLVASTICKAIAAGWYTRDICIFWQHGSMYKYFYGVGNHVRNKISVGAFRADDRNVLGITVTRGEPVLLHDAAEGKISPYVPEWFKATNIQSSILMSNHPKSAATIVICLGWDFKQQIALSSSDALLLKTLLCLLYAAKKLAATQ